MSVRKVFKAHQKEVTSLCWHPENDGLLASGGYDGALHFWGTQGSSSPIESIPLAHEGPIWSLAWHPLGHLLVSGSNDYSTRFWSRARPGDSNFEQFLPKRVGLGATEATAIVEQPPAGETQEILQSGVFAELPWPPCSEERLAILNGTLALASPEPEPVVEPAVPAVEDKATQSPSAPMIGLSLGEGPKAKNVLDTSDFDFEEKTLEAKPKVLTKVEPNEEKPKKMAKVEPVEETGAVPEAKTTEVAPVAEAVTEAAPVAPQEEPAVPEANSTINPVKVEVLSHKSDTEKQMVVKD